MDKTQNNGKIILSSQGLEKRYISGQDWLVVLKDISIDFCKGEIIAILGPSGAGKSTLLHLLGGLDRPSRGTVFLENNNLYSYSELELAKIRNQQIGFLFQFHHLLPEFNALENVGMPCRIMGLSKEISNTRAEILLTRLGLKDRLYHRPGELSGGEQQRVALARALVNNPKVILADEPTGNLDRNTGQQVLDLLCELQSSHEHTIIIVTHDESIAECANRHIHLLEGRIVNDKII